MDSPFELPIHIAYRPPGWLAIVLSISHCGAIICIFAVPVPPWSKIALLAVICVSLLWSLYRVLHRRYVAPPIMLILNTTNEWRLADRRDARPITLLPGAFVHPGLLVLRFKDGRRICPVILTPGMLKREVFRRLRVRLRYENKATSYWESEE